MKYTIESLEALKYPEAASILGYIQGLLVYVTMTNPNSTVSINAGVINDFLEKRQKENPHQFWDGFYQMIGKENKEEELE